MKEATGSLVYSPRALAEKWNVPLAEIRTAIADGSLKARKVGSAVLITEESAREFLADHNAQGEVPSFEEGDRLAFRDEEGELREGKFVDQDDDSGKVRVEVPGLLWSSVVELDPDAVQVITLPPDEHKADE